MVFKRYSFEHITLEDEEHKILKRLFDQSKVIEEQEIDRIFFANHRMIRINQYMTNYHLFLDDDADDLLVKAYILKKYVLSLLSKYMKYHVFTKHCEYTKMYIIRN
jgi:hypothetical protein